MAGVGSPCHRQSWSVAMNELILTTDPKTDLLRIKVQRSIDRLKAHEPAEGYYVADSFGKDSCCILELCKMAGVKYDAHHSFTTVDPPELIKFGKQYHPETEIHKPELSMFQLIEKKMTPPTRIIRFCCEALKETGGVGRMVATGIRWQESNKRAKRRMVESCNKSAGKTYLHPVIDWTTDDVWQFIREYDIPYCSLYDEGFKRLGCIMCPMQGTKGMLRDAERWPKYAAAYKRALNNTGYTFDWWVSGKQSVCNDGVLPFDDQ
jgi:phosphoadenosine phosphosulfate reductase